MSKKVEPRFYAARSHVYGWTVYDRETQTPAFEFGAEIHMDQLKAVMLAMRLHRRYKEPLRLGKLLRSFQDPGFQWDEIRLVTFDDNGEPKVLAATLEDPMNLLEDRESEDTIVHSWQQSFNADGESLVCVII